MRLVANAEARRGAPWTPAQDWILSDGALAEARSVISSWSGYAPTPLVALPGLAASAGVASLHLKDESTRFGIGSFKALGGAYAVARVLAEAASQAAGRSVGAGEIMEGSMPDIVGRITVTCATDGNHGRSVAWGAQRFGCRAVIFIHETVSEGRRAAIARFGAEVRRVPGTYDDSVRIAAETARSEGWHVVSDTSWDGYTDVPRHVMQGYEIMAAEAFEALDDMPTHIFLQTGVGGMAAAVAALAKRRWGPERPCIVLADPEGAACWGESYAAGQPTPAKGVVETMQAGLACGEVSLLAWEILKDHADFCVTVPDADIAPAMQRLAAPLPGDPVVVAGESAVAGLVACLGSDAAIRRAIGLDAASRVLVFSTEGDTDPDLYRAITGVAGDALRGSDAHVA
jgi:diaminopropionate ammonia-lyase